MNAKQKERFKWWGSFLIPLVSVGLTVIFFSYKEAKTYGADQEKLKQYSEKLTVIERDNVILHEQDHKLDNELTAAKNTFFFKRTIDSIVNATDHSEIKEGVNRLLKKQGLPEIKMRHY